MDDANDIHIMDYDFTLGLDAYESHLKRKKSFLNPKNKNKIRKNNVSLYIYLNVPASKDEPFKFQHLNKNGRPSKFYRDMISICLDQHVIIVRFVVMSLLLNLCTGCCLRC